MAQIVMREQPAGRGKTSPPLWPGALPAGPGDGFWWRDLTRWLAGDGGRAGRTALLGEGAREAGGRRRPAPGRRATGRPAR